MRRFSPLKPSPHKAAHEAAEGVAVTHSHHKSREAAHRHQLETLEGELAALKAQLELATEGHGFKCGTLFKYRPWAEGVFKVRWPDARVRARGLPG
jgi:hypothetical protein